MLATLKSAALAGLDPVPVTLEVSITNGLPAFHVVGLPDAAVRESRERVVSALRESGYAVPLRRITANLAPAGLRKEGSAFDLPLALAVLAASGQLPAERLRGWLAVGELALDGALRRVRGALAYADCAAALGAEALVVPAASAREAALAGAVPVWPARSLREVCAWVTGAAAPRPVAVPDMDGTDAAAGGADGAGAITLDDIAGQERAKRALLAAAAGGHNVIFVGPPGAGKTLLARALPGLLPPLTRAEALEVTRIHSVAGLLADDAGVVRARPFRAPHSSASPPALLGGGAAARPGEITLAHRGVLFLDELPEFRRDALEALRQPLEEGRIALGRAAHTVRFPAVFTLVAAMNGCFCGRRGHPRKACRCTPDALRRYRARLSEPLLDRMDVQLEIAPVRSRELATLRLVAPQHDAARRQVAAARARQAERGARENARLGAAELERLAPLPATLKRRLLDAVEALGLSARGYHRVWRLARTLADLDGVENVGEQQLTEAMSFRAVERERWF